MSAFYGRSGAPDFGLQDNCSNLRLLFVSIQSHFVLYTLTESKIKFSYKNKVHLDSKR